MTKPASPSPSRRGSSGSSAQPKGEEAAASPPASDPVASEEVRSYRAVQAVYGPDGLVPAGEIFVAAPSSGLAKSMFTVPVEPEEAAPTAVADALADADDE